MTTLENKNLYKYMLRIVLPIAGQNLITVGVNMTDTVMLGTLGDTVISGCALANQLTFIYLLFGFGLAGGTGLLISQYWGKGDRRAIEKIAAIGMDISLAVSLVFTFVGVVLPETFLGLYTNNPEVVREGASYLRIVGFTYFITAFGNLYLHVMRSLESVGIALTVLMSSFLMNIVLNSLLIFGLLGFPALGIRGAAIATLCARVLELVLSMGHMKFFNRKIKIRLRDMLHIDRVLFKDFIRYSTPVVVGELTWGVGFSLQTAIIGNLGTAVVSAAATAAVNVTGVARQLSSVVMFGVADASRIVVAKTIGAGREREACRTAGTLCRISVGMGVAAGLFMLLIGVFIDRLGILKISGLAMGFLKGMIFANAAILPFISFNATSIVGILRGGGDTRCAFLIDFLAMWGWALPVGVLAGFILKLPPVWVFALMLTDEMWKAPTCFLRMKGGKWLKNLTR